MNLIAQIVVNANFVPLSYEFVGGMRTDEAGPAMPMEECLKLLPQDSMEAETANDQRQLRQWGSGQLTR